MQSVIRSRYFLFLMPVLVLCFHVVMMFVVYRLEFLISYITEVDPYYLRDWDAFWYASIAEHGYLYDEAKASNSGFFPLFPYEWKLLWKLTDAGVAGVCLFNFAMFFSGMIVLRKAFDFSWMYVLVFISIPSNIFMYVPYTEATFFFFSALVLAGLKGGNNYLVVTGLFFAALTKPTALFFIPALICMEILTAENRSIFFKRVALFCSVPLLSTLCVVIIQYVQTGVWFAYFKTQSRFWHRSFQLPEFPLTTWGAPKVLWLDGVALFFGLLALCLLVWFFAEKLRKRPGIETNRATIFSVAYLFLGLLSVLFFNGKDATGGTSLMGLNRYVLATPYFVVFLVFISHSVEPRRYHWFLYTALAITVLFSLKYDSTGFADYTMSDKFAYQFFIGINILLYALMSRKFDNRFLACLYLLNICVQVKFMWQFANGIWIG